MKILEEKLITDAEAKELLEELAKRKELTLEQRNALEILKKFLRIDAEKAKKLVEELKSSVPKLREREAVAVANFLPEDKDELRVVLEKAYANFSQEEVEKILEIIKKHA